MIVVIQQRDDVETGYLFAKLGRTINQRETTRLSLRRSWSSVGAEVVQVPPGNVTANVLV